MRVKTDKQHALRADRAQPLLQAGPGKGAIDILFKTFLGTETKFGAESRRWLRSPSPGHKRAGFRGLVVVDDPGDGLAQLAGLLDSQANVLECVCVIRDGSQSGRGEFVLNVDNDESLHGWILLRNILDRFVPCYNKNQRHLIKTEIFSV